MVIPIMQGRLRGKKWIVGSATHGCWLGTFEHEKQAIFADVIKESSVVYDIGANVGFYTLLASELVKSKGSVIAFEPLPDNIHYLKKHIEMNKCQNVKIFETGVADFTGESFFATNSSRCEGSIAAAGPLRVNIIKLDDLVARDEIPVPDYIKIDVEGAELKVLKGAENILSKSSPVIFLATHGQEIHAQCCSYLRSLGYNLKSFDQHVIDSTDEILASKSF